MTHSFPSRRASDLLRHLTLSCGTGFAGQACGLPGRHILADLLVPAATFVVPAACEAASGPTTGFADRLRCSTAGRLVASDHGKSQDGVGSCDASPSPLDVRNRRDLPKQSEIGRAHV